MEIVLIRHGATDWNLEGRCQGATDRELSAAGIRQAEEIARRLGVESFQAIYSSGLRRARQTAEAIRQLCNSLADFSAIRGLLPDDPPDWIRDRLTGESRQVVVVGHFPHMPRVVQALKRDEGGGAFDFPLHGAIALEEVDERWVEQWRVSPTT